MGNMRTNAVNDFQSGYDLPEPPELAGIKLLKAEREVFDALVSSRASSDWTLAQLIMAYQCAKVTVEITKIRQEYRHTSPIDRNGRGAAVVAPHLKAVDCLTGQQISLMTKMGLSAGSDSKRGAARRQKAQNKGRSVKNVTLLAQPD